MREYTVLLLGDFIRLQYQDRTARLLAEETDLRINLVAPKASTGDSTQLAARIEDLLSRFDPDAVHFNAGLEDVRWIRAEHRNHTSLGEYELNLQRVIDACKPRLGGDIVFALTTPVNDEKQCDQPDSPFDRCNREIEEYNIAAQQIMLSDDVLVNNLNLVIAERDEEYLAEDGVSLTDDGAEAAARATAHAIRSLWH